MDTLISLLRNNLLYIVLIGAIIVLIISRLTKHWQKSREIVPQDAAKRLNSILKTYRNKSESSAILKKIGREIPLTLVDSKKVPRSSKYFGQLLIEQYENMQGKNDNHKKNLILDKTLILGEPGSGKSTLLHQYTLGLMDEELDENDFEKIRLPIFLPLRDWAKKKQPFNVFLPRYLMSVLFPDDKFLKPFLTYWMSKGKFILLLDGLDEMNKEDAKKCIHALNTFTNETISSVIVSCQLEYYEMLLKEQCILNVNETAVIQRLKPKEMQKYLYEEGAIRLSRTLYQENKYQELKEIANTPLMAQALAQTYPDTSDWLLSTLEKDPFQIYTRNAIRNKKGRYDDDYLSKMEHRLTRLAKRMGEYPFFYFRPDNLPDHTSKELYIGSTKKLYVGGAKKLYVGSTWLIIIVLGGAASLLMVSGTFQLWQLLPMITIIAGFYGYLRKSILTGVYMTVLYILAFVFPFVAAEATREKTKLKKAWDIFTTLAFILFLPLFLGVILLICARMIGIPLWLGLFVAGVATLLIEGLRWYTFYRIEKLQILQPLGNNSPIIQTFLSFVHALIFQHIEPLLPEALSPKLSLLPMKALILRIAEGLVLGGMICLLGFLFWHTNLLLLALLLAASIWLDRGLGAGIRGYLLRFWFFWFEVLPWKATFLDDAVTCNLLARTGGDCYKFVFETPMQNYFRRRVDNEVELSDTTNAAESFKEQPPQPSPHDDEGKLLEIFCCCHHDDEEMLNLLKKHLKPFQREYPFTTQSSIDLAAGTLLKEEIHKHLESAAIILLLISPDFMNSDDCNDKMRQAIQRHDEGSAVVLPILLRPTLWEEIPNIPFAHLQILPKDKVPISQWMHSAKVAYSDEAFNIIASEIYQVILELLPFHH